eukprot:402805-Hanusia_phi.AAC.1
MIGLRCGGTVACCMMAAYAIGRTSRSSVDNQTREEEGDTRALGEEVNKLRRELEEMRLKREADRSGRIRAERALREQTLGNKNASSGAAAADSDNSPDGQGDQESVKYCNVKPIGWLRSCYRRRFGTPRQGTVVHGGRASLKLTPECNPLMSTANLSEYSHLVMTAARDLVDELEFYDDFETVYSTLNEVLSNDIRSLHMRDSDSVTTNEKPNIHFDNLKVFFQVNEENTVQVTSIELGRVSKTGSTLDDSRVSSPADCVSRLDVDVRRPLD